MSKRPFTHKDYVTGYEYFRNLSQEKDERIKDLEVSVKEWRDKADSELTINAKLHTETAYQAKRIKELETEKAESLNRPHLEPTNCPTYHDGCHCTVETLIHNIKRAEKADKRIKELEEAIKCFLDRWKKSGPQGSAQWEKFGFSIQILKQALKG